MSETITLTGGDQLPPHNHEGSTLPVPPETQKELMRQVAQFAVNNPSINPDDPRR